mmetsp:Transcript_14325/g.21142  ORF Transcript_14325/g.21142 Transcript_14325/m.21142 type:complete len:100 (+) Transcript_14325:97-396(+)
MIIKFFVIAFILVLSEGFAPSGRQRLASLQQLKSPPAFSTFSTGQSRKTTFSVGSHLYFFGRNKKGEDLGETGEDGETNDSDTKRLFPFFQKNKGRAGC